MNTPSVELPRRELAFRDERGGFSLTLKRNCSISPAGLASAFALLAIVVLAIGVAFSVAGAWLVLPFAGLEVLALAAAFVAYGRHAADYERIGFRRGRFVVEVVEGERASRFELDARRLRVCVEKDQGLRVMLKGAGQELEVGRNLDADTRLALAAELEKRLRF